MRHFAPRRIGTQTAAPTKPALTSWMHSGHRREPISFLPSRRSTGNQAISQDLETKIRGAQEGSGSRETSHSARDFSGIPVHARTKPRDLPAVDAGMSGNQARDSFGIGAVRVLPIPVRTAQTRLSPAMPTLDPNEQNVFQPPPAGGAPAVAGSAGAPAGSTESCAQPRSMNKIVSGAFLGGLTMDHYFPDLSGRGFWDHGGTGGPFVTSTQAGGNAQLFGVIPSPCLPSQFRLEQSATPVRFRIGGVAHSLEGTTFDDIARSGRDFTAGPARQEFLGGGSAPLGYIISMADPPSVSHGPSQPDVERDTNFVSSLVGPGGRQSVRWSQSVRVAGGAVTANTLT